MSKNNLACLVKGHELCYCNLRDYKSTLIEDHKINDIYYHCKYCGQRIAWEELTKASTKEAIRPGANTWNRPRIRSRLE